MYNDDDIEMMELEAAGRAADYTNRAYKDNEVSDEALAAVYSAAKAAAYYYVPVFEAVLQTCHDYEIPIDDERVQQQWTLGAKAGKDGA